MFVSWQDFGPAYFPFPFSLFLWWTRLRPTSAKDIEWAEKHPLHSSVFSSILNILNWGSHCCNQELAISWKSKGFGLAPTLVCWSMLTHGNWHHHQSVLGGRPSIFCRQNIHYSFRGKWFFCHISLLAQNGNFLPISCQMAQASLAGRHTFRGAV